MRYRKLKPGDKGYLEHREVDVSHVTKSDLYPGVAQPPPRSKIHVEKDAPVALEGIESQTMTFTASMDLKPGPQAHNPH